VSGANTLTISSPDGTVIGTIEVDKNIQVDDIKEKLLSSTKKKVRGTVKKYKDISRVRSINNDTCIEFKFSGNMKFTFDLVSRKVLHSDGTEFLKTHYDRIIADMNQTISLAEGWVKKFLAYMEIACCNMCNVSSRTERLGTYLYAFRGSDCVGPTERIAKSGILGDNAGLSQQRFLGYSIDWKAPTIHEMLGVDPWFIRNFKGDDINYEVLLNYRKSLEHPQLPHSFKRAYYFVL